MTQEDSNVGDVTMVLSLSSAFVTLKEAENLIGLGERELSLRPILAASSAVALAAALAQGIRTGIETALANQVEGRGDWMATGPYSGLTMSSLRYQMIQLPQLLSENTLKLKSCSMSRALHKLINIRNLLVHVEEPVTVTTIEVREPLLELKIELPKSPWTQVSLADAHCFSGAVRAYLEDIALPEKLPIVEGRLLERA